MGKDRLAAFSDGVIAIIITIMVLELHVPHGADWQALVAIAPSFLTYVLSFVYIAIYWNNHHHLLRATKRISAAVMWSNLVLLFWLSLTPFATAWVGSNYTRVLPATTYGVVALGSALAFFVLIKSILRANVDDDAIRAAIGKNTKGKISPLIYVLGVALAFVTPYLAYGCYVTVSLVWIIPDRRLATKS